MSSTQKLPRLLFAATTAALFGCASNDVTTPRMESDLAGPTTQSLSDFGIQTTATDDESISAAWDGTNYLAAIMTGGDTANVGDIKFKMVSSSGVAGTAVTTGRIGSLPQVAFNGQLYFMVWADRTAQPQPCVPQPFCIPDPAPVNVRGVFLTPAGTLSGPVFKISASNDVINVGGVIWTGTQWFVSYCVLDKTSFELQVRGRFVSPTAVLSKDILIASNSITGGTSNLATNGGNVLATFTAGASFQSVRARLIHSNSTMAAATTVDASGPPSNRPVGVAFNGGTYMVVWNDLTGGDECDIFGRMVTTAGVATGTKFTIEGNVGAQVTTGVSAAGSEFFVTWLDLAADPASSLAKGQFWSLAGTAHGGVKTLFTTNATTHKIAAIAAPVVNGSKFLFLVNRALPGVDPQDFTALNTWDIRGSIKTVAP